MEQRSERHFISESSWLIFLISIFHKFDKACDWLNILFILIIVSDDSKNTSGTSTPRPQKNPLVRWEESLMGVTSLSQIFLHLAVLEGSVAWSKSALHARCKLCRRKGDAEKMLLCDNCDRGHHMYCLKPPVKVRLKAQC